MSHHHHEDGVDSLVAECHEVERLKHEFLSLCRARAHLEDTSINAPGLDHLHAETPTFLELMEAVEDEAVEAIRQELVRLEERGPPPAAQAVVLHDQYNAIITDYYKLVHTETGNAIAIKHLELKQKELEWKTRAFDFDVRSRQFLKRKQEEGFQINIRDVAPVGVRVEFWESLGEACILFLRGRASQNLPTDYGFIYGDFMRNISYLLFADQLLMTGAYVTSLAELQNEVSVLTEMGKDVVEHAKSIKLIMKAKPAGVGEDDSEFHNPKASNLTRQHRRAISEVASLFGGLLGLPQLSYGEILKLMGPPRSHGQPHTSSSSSANSLSHVSHRKNHLYHA